MTIVAGTLTAWAASQFFGIGEIIDAILLVVGAFTVGLSVFEGANELYQFAKTAIGASNDAALDEAGRHFAKAVTILGITTVTALLMRQSAKAVLRRGAPQAPGLPRIAPRPQVRPLRRLASLPSGALGGD